MIHEDTGLRLRCHNGQLVDAQTGRPVVNCRLTDQRIDRKEDGVHLFAEIHLMPEDDVELIEDFNEWKRLTLADCGYDD
jgi:hypothetical protein